ncbi:hypothetical protein GCM10011515_17340 [Tsuneonella deserti]|uniref:Sugar transporter n=1 Tax=Tsuneonella deserti TaxID=2035528 RepID=A0ABQ1SB85_9SPHN|nr:hypothetical protein [Tsuneonella deserti]GGD98086.1 hypothetical protein GCM10011515_17340 [Tsuneonella deserti]
MEQAVVDQGPDGTVSSGSERAPWHLWVVGVLSLLWNAMGAFDYSMTHLRGDEYLRQMGMSDDVVAWFAAVPAWATAGWAFGVWGAIAGSLLLLARSRHAVTAFGLSLAGVVVMTIYTLGHAAPDSVNSPGAQAFNWAIKAVALLLLIYALAMRRREVLR